MASRGCSSRARMTTARRVPCRWADCFRARQDGSARRCSRARWARTHGSSSSECCSCSALSLSASNEMREFLLSVGYDRWILPALLVIPLVGALLLLLLSGRRTDGEDEVLSGAAKGSRLPASAVFAVAFVLSIGLWGACGPAVTGWQER